MSGLKGGSWKRKRRTKALEWHNRRETKGTQAPTPTVHQRHRASSLPDSNQEYRVPPSSTCATTYEARSSDGCDENTVGSPGRNCAAATAADGGGPPARTGSCSTPPGYAPHGTATEAQSSHPHGQPRDEDNGHRTGLVERPVP
jgi:hypothetical protein